MTMAKETFVGFTNLPDKTNLKERQYEWIWNGIWMIMLLVLVALVIAALVEYLRK